MQLCLSEVVHTPILSLYDTHTPLSHAHHDAFAEVSWTDSGWRVVGTLPKDEHSESQTCNILEPRYPRRPVLEGNLGRNRKLFQVNPGRPKVHVLAFCLKRDLNDLNERPLSRSGQSFSLSLSICLSLSLAMRAPCGNLWAQTFVKTQTRRITTRTPRQQLT